MLDSGCWRRGGGPGGVACPRFVGMYGNHVDATCSRLSTSEGMPPRPRFLSAMLDGRGGLVGNGKWQGSRVAWHGGERVGGAKRGA